ncbi:MAG: ADOP family duplicated permease [Candidatus Acidiferrales bacterium]
MRWLNRTWSFFRGLVHRRADERELDAEVRGYAEMLADEKAQKGMSELEARRAARVEMGGIEQVKEEVRSGRAGVWLETLWQDVRFGARMLRKNPGFTAVAVLTLALGIGANTAIFSMVNSVLLRPLAYRQPQRLYLVREIVPELSQTYPTLPANLQNFRVWQRECHSFDEVAIVEPYNMTLTGNGEAEQISGGRASANLFDVLGIVPELGRTFLPQEDTPGNDHVVMLTDSFWRDRFHADPTMVGRSITLDGKPFQVVGILPASFRFPKGAQLGVLTEFPPRMDYFKPLGLDPEQFSPIGEFDFAAIARLRPGTSIGQALAELNVIQARIAKEAKQGVGLRAEIIPLESEVVGTARRGLLLLLAGVGAVLLIVCMNLANLLLVRIPGRAREAGIRTALGASRARLARQLFTESAVLAVFGGVLGISLAYLGLRWLVAVAPANLPRIDEVHVDARVLWFTVFVSMLTGILFGALPAWRVSHVEPQQALKAGAATVTESRPARRLRESLIGFEVGAGTLLLILAGLLTASMVRLLGVDKGFTTEHVLAVDVSLPPQSYTKPEQKEEFYDNVLARVRALPGVSSAGWISKLPLEGQEQVDNINVPGRSTTGLQAPVANYRYVSPGYFQSMGIPLRQGRVIEQADRDRHVAVISESVAVKMWPGENSLGKQFHEGSDQRPLTEVIGVVADIRAVALDEPPLMMVYLPIGPGSRSWSGAHASLVVRAAILPEALGTAVRGAIQSVDPGVPILHLRPMAEIVSESVGIRRFQMVLACLFAIFALLLSALGIYGVVGYSVARRRQELGIRMALGARGSDLRNLVLLQGMSPVVAGWAAGVLTALVAGRVMRGILFGVTAQDPLTIASVTLVVLVTAALACYIPARRATKVDPMVALRYE